FTTRASQPPLTHPPQLQRRGLSKPLHRPGPPPPRPTAAPAHRRGAPPGRAGAPHGRTISDACGC
ncbi:hypothetical protein FS722_25005, partial [Pseudomonas aeruginosa]